MKIAYFEGRPAAHPLHRSFALSLGAKPFFVDFLFRWQDKSRPFIRRTLSWFACAFFFPNKKDYNVFLVDGIHVFPVLMRVFGLIKKEQKLVAHLGSHTLYFLYINRFSKFSKAIHLFALKRYDALMCEGKMAQELVIKLLGEESPNTYPTFLGPLQQRADRYIQIRPDLNADKFLYIGDVSTEFRIFYKGIDLMLEAFGQAYAVNNKISLTIVGDYNKALITNILQQISPDCRKAIKFLGRSEDLEGILAQHSFYLHPSRGDAFPTATIEAMTAGLIPIVSEWTGTKEVVAQIDKELIAGLEVADIKEKILQLSLLSGEERKRISDTCKAVASKYTEETAIVHYQNQFKKAMLDLDIKG